MAARLRHTPTSSLLLVNPPCTMPGLITFPHVCTKEHRELLLPFAVKVARAAVVWEAGRFPAAGMRARTQISSAVTGHYCQTKGLCAAALGPTAPRPSVSWGRHLSVQNPLLHQEQTCEASTVHCTRHRRHVLPPPGLRSPGEHRRDNCL